MNIVPFIIQVLALISLLLAALNWPNSRVSWLGLGMFLWLLSLMVAGHVALHATPGVG